MYTVTVFQSGKAIKTTTPFQAPNALAAISTVEEQYKLKAQAVKMGDEIVKWNGYEFQARKVN